VRAKVGRGRDPRGVSTLEMAVSAPSVRPASEGALRSMRQFWIGKRENILPERQGPPVELEPLAVDGICRTCRALVAAGKEPLPLHPHCAAHIRSQAFEAVR